MLQIKMQVAEVVIEALNPSGPYTVWATLKGCCTTLRFNTRVEIDYDLVKRVCDFGAAKIKEDAQKNRIDCVNAANRITIEYPMSPQDWEETEFQSAISLQYDGWSVKYQARTRNDALSLEVMSAVEEFFVAVEARKDYYPNRLERELSDRKSALFERLRKETSERKSKEAA